MPQGVKRAIVACLLLILVGRGQAAFAQAVPVGFEVLEVAAGLDTDAVGFAILPDGRILLIHQFSGVIKLIVAGILSPEPVFTVPHLAGLVEKGLLGIAVDPDFPDQPYIYLFHTHDGSPDSNRVSRFTLTGDLTNPDSDNLAVDPASQLVLIEDMPAESHSHNGGTLRFAPDKTLLISHGDDKNRSRVQDLTSLKGKILRINRDGSIPADNPVFPEEPAGKRPEIFAFGFRNPFRFTVDPETGHLFVGDVGHQSSEEIDLASSDGGENFGWPRYEGTLDFDPQADLSPPAPIFPIWEYHLDGQANSVIALVAYRRQNPPNDFSFPDGYDGSVFYADFYDDVIYTLQPDAAGGWTSVEFATGFSNPVDATLGKDGSVYILEYGSALRQIVYTNRPVPVELFSFAAELDDDKVVLRWQTISEIHNYGFEVQRSFASSAFAPIAFVPGKGNSSQPVRYSYEDASPGPGPISYRLKQIDIDGGFEYSRVVTVEVSGPRHLILMQNYPNPFNAATIIVYKLPARNQDPSQRQAVLLAIFDIQGRHVRTLVEEVRIPGIYSVLWDGRDRRGLPVASAVYVYTVKFGDLSQSKKMVYLR